MLHVRASFPSYLYLCFFKAEDVIRYHCVTGVQTCALPLAEFASPRDAVRAAVGLQASCITRTLGDPRDRLPVGVGLDIGEPADEGANRSAAALNVAARLCARAAAGEVLSSAELVHLAGPLDGLSYVDAGS